tara:strand:+ start:1895 stop:3046 length:1152 start_codon:yes stop_codon:yes gene_type:complete
MKTKNTDRKNIVFVLPSLTAGGAERVLISLMNGLDRERFKPFIVTVSDKGELHDFIDHDIPHYSLQKESVFKSAPALYKMLKQLKPDVVMSTMAHMNFTVMALKPFFLNTSFIIREAITPSFFFNKYKNRGFIIKGLYKRYYPKADMVISPAATIFDEFINELHLDAHNFKVLPNPVNLQKMRAQDNFKAITDKRKNTVAFVACGRLGQQKGFDRLISRLAGFSNKTDWSLTIYGEGPERENLESLIQQHGLTRQITLAGLVKEPYTAFAQADCFLLPSRSEGLPNVVLESLAAGTPVIATQESGGIHEIGQHTSKEALTIVKNMSAFMKEMESVQPNPTSQFRASLLPAVYNRDNVLDEFNRIIVDMSSSSRPQIAADRKAA